MLCVGKGKDYWDEENIIEEMPSCRQMLNIFHPFDPVAYRFISMPYNLLELQFPPTPIPTHKLKDNHIKLYMEILPAGSNHLFVKGTRVCGL